MTIEKLSSGKYRISEMRNKKRYRVILDHEPGQKEAKKIFDSLEGKYSNSTPFKTAAESYIKSKANILSPSTIRGYNAMLKNLDADFKELPLDKITLPVLQTLANDIAEDHTPKTVRNVNGFVMSVLKFYDSDVKSPKLPQKEKKKIYIPSEEDVKRILAMAKGTKYEVPFILGTLGLRKSEICALTKEDLNGNVLTINKALVLNTEKEWELKTTKTEDSTRTIVVPDYVAELIRENGVCEYSPNAIYAALRRYQKSLGIPYFAFHKLRHFLASYMHELGYSDKQIQEFGGWKTDAVMKTVYQHAMEMDKVKSSMANNINGLLS